jgi:hypothetical protein
MASPVTQTAPIAVPLGVIVKFQSHSSDLIIRSMIDNSQIILKIGIKIATDQFTNLILSK